MLKNPKIGLLKTRSLSESVIFRKLFDGIKLFPMYTRFRVFLNLYKRLCWVTLPSTLVIWWNGGLPTFGSSADLLMVFIPFYLFLRTICHALIWYLFRMDNRKGFYFYHHFGFSEWQLAIGVYVFEMILFVLLVLITGLFI